ncbi:MAG TPA: hypothetical protein VMR70_13295 [Flavisolibacter sp.]|nr:hypothetical protein [Flavisolibacter sp.]
MLRISFKIWLLANLLVFGLFALSLFPRGFLVGWEALQFSALFSLPALLVVYGMLRLLKALRSAVVFSWILFLLSTGFAAFLSSRLFLQWSIGGEDDLSFTLGVALVTGYAAVIICSSSLHYLFQKIQYGHENN